MDRNKKLTVMLTEEEMIKLKKKAKSCNLTLSKYVRFMIEKDKIISLKGLENHVIEQKIGGLDKQLTKIGNGISQITHYLGKGGDVSIETANKLKDVLKSIEKRMELIEKAIEGEYSGFSENKRY
jgi:hypothetical protein